MISANATICGIRGPVGDLVGDSPFKEFEFGKEGRS